MMTDPLGCLRCHDYCVSICSVFDFEQGGGQPAPARKLPALLTGLGPSGPLQLQVHASRSGISEGHHDGT